MILDCSTYSLGDSLRSGRGRIKDVRAFDAAMAGRPLWTRRTGWAETILLAVAAVAISLGAAAWITDSNQTAFASAALPESSDRLPSFEDRFFPVSGAVSLAVKPALQPLDRFAPAAAQTRVRTTLIVPDPQLMSPEPRAGLVDETRATNVSAVPLPRSRPAAADLEARPGSVVAQADRSAGPDGRTLLQKLSDLLPARATLASLTPEALFRRGPDLAALGFDSSTAVYDISAQVVYLPNGSSLEAHSGMGSLRDDPEHVSVPNAGATPPAVYELKPREKLFHGVQALRMIPTEGSDTSGRSGLLTHSFMLGPKGDSNGCVSIKDYDRFLKAYNDGEINHLVVVPSLKSGTMASQRATTQS
jgi:hypothetical protein